MRKLKSLTFRLKQVLVVAALGEGRNGRVVHAVVERYEGRRPARDGRRARCGARRRHGRRDQTERRRTDDAADGVNWADARIREHLQR